VSKVKIEGGWFDEDCHIYTDELGVFVPSLTQILKLQGLSDYSGIDPEVLENAARRGTEVHGLAATFNQLGEIDPNWITDECDAYFSAYMKFLDDSHFKPDPAWTERSFIANIQGFSLGMTPDTYGTYGRYQAIIEFKCTSGEQPSWAVQTAAQEAGIFKSNRCGRVRRFALMLRKDATYKLIEYTNHDEDMATLVAALRCVWWRINHGQDLRRMVTE